MLERSKGRVLMEEETLKSDREASKLISHGAPSSSSSRRPWDEAASFSASPPWIPSLASASSFLRSLSLSSDQFMG